MKKIFLLSIFVISLAFAGKAQTSFIGVTYNMAVPMGETKDFINNYSWGVAAFDWRYMLNEKLGVGVNVAWQIFSEKITKGTIEVDNNVTLTGTQLRYLNYFPITAATDYFINPEGPVIFHVGAGLGAYRVLQRFDISGFVWDQNSWNFGFYPQVGVMIPAGSMNVWFNTKYHYIIAVNDYPSHSYLNLNIGISWFY